jgi:hypothetical protein
MNKSTLSPNLRITLVVTNFIIIPNRRWTSHMQNIKIIFFLIEKLSKGDTHSKFWRIFFFHKKIAKIFFVGKVLPYLCLLDILLMVMYKKLTNGVDIYFEMLLLWLYYKIWKKIMIFTNFTYTPYLGFQHYLSHLRYYVNFFLFFIHKHEKMK